MKQLHAVLILLTLLLSISACTSGNDTPAEHSTRPNVLFIAVDDLRPEIGAYGNEIIHTPNMDRIAAEGVVFTRAYVQQAVCNPSRASLLTGLRPDSLKVWDLQTDFRDTTPDAVTLPQHFMNNGYHTVAIGKIYHNVIPDSASWSEDKLHIPGYPFDPDAVYRDSVQVAYQESRKAEILASDRPNRNRDVLGEWYLKAGSWEAPDVDDNAYYDGAQTDVAIEKLAELKEKNEPFFFGIGFYRPHLPFNAPKKYWDLYDPDEIPLAPTGGIPSNVPVAALNNMRELRGYTDFHEVEHPLAGSISEREARTLKHGYYASVSYIDAQIGRLLDALDEYGLSENTIVVVWGDHGWKLGEHNSWGKMTNFEIDARAPWFMRGPGISNGTRYDGLVEFVDIYPTLAELAGIPVTFPLHGESAVDRIADSVTAGKSAVYTQFLREGIWIAPDGITYMGYSIRDTRYRYTVWINWDTGEWGGAELYDHDSDPDETRNMFGDADQTTIAADLHRQLKAEFANIPDRGQE